MYVHHYIMCTDLISCYRYMYDCVHYNTGDAAMEGLCGDEATATAYCLQLHRKVLYLSPLLAQKKFRKRGNKDGAVRAFCHLEAEGLGKVLEVGYGKGTSVASTCCFFLFYVTLEIISLVNTGDWL